MMTPAELGREAAKELSFGFIAIIFVVLCLPTILKYYMPTLHGLTLWHSRVVEEARLAARPPAMQPSCVEASVPQL
jgi:hypothetical protein